MKRKSPPDVAYVRCRIALQLVQKIADRYGIRDGGSGHDGGIQEIAGVNRSVIWAWRSGDVTPSKRLIERLERVAFGPPQTLFAVLHDAYRREHSAQEVTL
jgi:hypothetical protein